jgi:hypothetical protein
MLGGMYLGGVSLGGALVAAKTVITTPGTIHAAAGNVSTIGLLMDRDQA